MLACTGVGLPASFEPARSAKRQVRWAKKTIPIAISSSLTLPNSGITAGSDVAAAIQALPERQRLAVFLRYYADLDYQQIGEVLGIATGTVSATLSAAHRTLHTQLDEVPR